MGWGDHHLGRVVEATDRLIDLKFIHTRDIFQLVKISSTLEMKAKRNASLATFGQKCPEKGETTKSIEYDKNAYFNDQSQAECRMHEVKQRDTRPTWA